MKRYVSSILASTLLAFTLAGADHSTDPQRYFLHHSDVLDSKEFLEAPPDSASCRYTFDVDRYEWGKTMRDTDRGRRAVIDADLTADWLDRDFSEAFGMDLTPANAPHIVDLIENMKEDAGDLATRDAKEHYKRPRPFMVFNELSATPDDEAGLRKNGSYPSGHTAIGWATALVLAEINPGRQAEIIKRGYDFGQSRVICGAHFQSDVDAGRLVGAALVARLHADKNFRKKLDKAKKEFARKSK